MPGHGEAAKVPWQALEESPRRARMAADLPMAGLRIERSVRLGSKAWFEVEETVTNNNKLGRMYNLVQHPTIGPPFLDESVLVDSNARRGFMQSSPLPNPEEPRVWWPQALNESRAVDMRRLRDNPQPNVVSYVIDQDMGWTTAANPAKGLLIGYVWETADYPWLNMWRHVEGGKPLARGLEFGTTGLHQPFPVLAEKGRIFGRRLFRYLDADASETRRYLAFLLEIPEDFSGVATVERQGGTLRVTERAPQGRALMLELE